MLVGRINRRAFIAGLGGAAAWPLVARGQQSGKIPKIGVLWHAGNESEEAPYLGALRQGLNDLGYVEGKTIELENRFAGEQYDRFDALAAELVEAKVDVIVASVPSAAVAAKRATTKIPVTAAMGIEFLVGAPGLVNNIAHPGGSITGLSSMLLDLAGKHLEVLKDCIADLSAVALLFNANQTSRQYPTESQRAADSLGISLHVVDVRSPDELDRGFSQIAKARVNAVLLTPDPMFDNERGRIAQLALTERVPTIAWSPELTEAGVLMSYGANFPDLFRRAATYIDKILKGASPGDLPVEQPVKFDFAVNLKTAKTLGLTIPPALLVRATEVIE